jgi:hypothetical protein
MTQHTPEPPLDTAAILERLRAEVHAQRQAALAAGTQSEEQQAIERQLQHCAEQLEISRVISAHWPLEERTPVQRGINFVNKVVRRGLRWYINPIVEQQNAFNDTTARTLRLLIEGYTDLLHQQQAPTGQGGTDEPQPNARPQTATAQEPVDPDQSIQQLQALVDERAAAEPPAHFPDIELRPLVALAEQRQEVHAHWPLEERTPVQRVAALVQKGVRFYLRWLINPIVEQQNAFNTAAAGALRPLLAIDTEARVAAAARRVRRRQASRK